MASNTANTRTDDNTTNYCSYIPRDLRTERIGSLSQDGQTIQPLAFASGTPLSNLYEVINAGSTSNIKPSGAPVSRSSVKMLPPITGRDILCVGKNYAAHATEFNKSGYDSSDKVDQPTHPVIFTKRFTSIIADGDEIYPHEKFTSTLDYEGELGVIIGKAGYRIPESEAMEHVWGYTIINDVTARERQRDHKQFYIGKSADTFCPMGPVAVPKDRIQGAVRVQTRVNGELRQDATTDDLIFSIPSLIMTLSEGQTLMPGDVLATGTPAGVGFGLEPPKFLEPGDEVEVSITGLGSLKNRIAAAGSENPSMQRIVRESARIRTTNDNKTPDGNGLTLINGKALNYQRFGADKGTPAFFVHGLGGSMEYWRPVIHEGKLDSTYLLHLFDFEGHGLSQTSPLSEITIDSLADDLKAIFDHAGVAKGATLFAHSMGCLISVTFVLKYPGLVSKLVLMGPPPSPYPQASSKGTQDRAVLARSKGMGAVVDAVVSGSVAEETKSSKPVSVSAVRLSVLGQHPEGYAKACSALAKSSEISLDFSRIDAETLLVTGSEDKVCPPELYEKYSRAIKVSKGVVVLPGVGHWHNFEDPRGVAAALAKIE